MTPHIDNDSVENAPAVTGHERLSMTTQARGQSAPVDRPWSTAIELNMTLAGLRTAAAAVRDEPYDRLPALAGELEIAAMRLESIHERAAKLETALKRIERWFGEFPETGDFYDEDETRPVSYGAAHGSTGERDFMRQVAREALQ